MQHHASGPQALRVLNIRETSRADCPTDQSVGYRSTGHRTAPGWPPPPPAQDCSVPYAPQFAAPSDHEVDGSVATPALPKVRSPYDRGPDEQVNRKASIPFLLVHVAAVIGPLVFGVTTKAMIVFVVMVWGREWFITAGYHRYFAHRAYKTEPGVPALPRRRRRQLRPEGAAVVGRPPPRPPPLQRHRARHPLAAAGLLVEPRGLDPLRQVRRDPDRAHPGLRQVPRAALGRQVERPVPVDGRPSPASSSPAGRACSSGSSSAPSCSGTTRSS